MIVIFAIITLLLFVRDGVPLACTYNDDNEMIQVQFYQKLKGAASQLKELEFYTT